MLISSISDKNIPSSVSTTLIQFAKFNLKAARASSSGSFQFHLTLIVVSVHYFQIINH